ncbi:MAG TPA: hypothetical protein VLA88_03575 [Candidatus Saccharimonadales bacterium]|nr:hypothetical protein [Candidatus Saccharimonadales bacterium]
MKFTIPPAILTYLSKLKPLVRHHYFIVTVLLLSTVAGVIYTVNQTLNSPTDEEYKGKQFQATIGSKFNKTTTDTINKIKTLQKSTDNTGQTKPFPTGRINPFAE